METKILEINLISAQGLKPPSANLRRMQTYAVVWIDSSNKLRTRIDRLGSENPTWNDKFLFKVSPEFLSSETSGVLFEIYAVGCIRNALVGTVRFLISNLPLSSTSTAIIRTPSFIALQIRRPSGRFHGVLNIGASEIDGSDFPALDGVSAIGYRDLMGKSFRRKRRQLKKSSSKSMIGEDLGDLSDDGDSTSSSSSAASTTLKNWNRVTELAGNHVRPSSEGRWLFCGFLTQRRLPPCMSDQNLQVYGGPQKEN